MIIDNKVYVPQIGDIILEDSERVGAKIVKYFMRSPTVWHDIFRMIFNKIEYVPYYHVSMIAANGFDTADQALVIEQQSKVKLSIWNPNIKQIIFRKKTQPNLWKLAEISRKDLGQGYDILNCFGKFLTWLTGIKLFARYVEYPKAEICINRVAKWYRDVIGEKFGAETHSELTTQLMYKYLLKDSGYEIVYKIGE